MKQNILESASDLDVQAFWFVSLSPPKQLAHTVINVQSCVTRHDSRTFLLHHLSSI